MNVKETLKSNRIILHEYSKRWNGEFIKGDLRKSSRVIIKSDNNEFITKYVRYSDGKTSRYVTEIKSVLNHLEEFEFSIKNKGLIKGIMEKIGLSKPEMIDDEEFQKKYLVQSNNPDKLHMIMSKLNLKQLVKKERRIRISICKNKAGKRVLCIRKPGRVNDPNQLDSLTRIALDIASII